ncbi:MAG: response regulator [Candidatus Omnitrophica bacterium]|nr:response regulator [Candidatus Omnitrophota bacterium]
MNVPLRVLVVDDSENDMKLMLRELTYGGYDPAFERVDTAAAMAAALEKGRWDIVVTDCIMPRFSAQAVLALLKERRVHLPVVVVSGKIAEDVAAACIQAGAQDFVTKGEKGKLVAAVERALVRHAELSHSNAELQQFIEAASHHLVEPLRALLASSQHLAQRYRGKLDAEGDKAIAGIQEGALEMQTLMESLTEYARVGADGKPLACADCSSLLDLALVNLRKIVEENQAVVTHDDLPTLMADGPHLTLLFQHLVENGIKFRREEPPRIHVSAEHRQNKWIFCVRDNGMGIDPKEGERLFGIFERLHHPGEYPGVGMGLAIAKRIVECHGGRIWFESKPGAGSAFFFTLPMFIPSAPTKMESFKLSA